MPASWHPWFAAVAVALLVGVAIGTWSWASLNDRLVEGIELRRRWSRQLPWLLPLFAAHVLISTSWLFALGLAALLGAVYLRWRVRSAAPIWVWALPIGSAVLHVVADFMEGAAWIVVAAVPTFARGMWSEGIDARAAQSRHGLGR